MRLWTLVVMTAACTHREPAGVHPAPPSPAGPPSEAVTLATDALVPVQVAIVASPAAAGPCMTEPATCYQHERAGRRLLVNPDVVLVRWHEVAIYMTPAEARGVTAFFAGDGPRRFETAAFHGLVGDLGIQRSTRDNLELIGKDAGLAIDGPDGFFIECFDCKAPAIVTALASLGAHVTAR